MTILGHDRNTVYELGRINVLVAGFDDGGNADTIMVVSYKPSIQEIAMLSIPRDTFVGENVNRALPGDRLNSLFSAQRPEILLEAVQEITNLEIPYYLFIDLDAFVELVDIIGGVYFYVPMDMRYDDFGDGLHIDLEQGYHKLYGEQAEHLV
ncbi:MAG: LCP family protein, partial [Oscillospiraceae bacterium]|nr:LCP family protein [Oscillospiraceae bacterium]